MRLMLGSNPDKCQRSFTGTRITAWIREEGKLVIRRQIAQRQLLELRNKLTKVWKLIF